MHIKFAVFMLTGRFVLHIIWMGSVFPPVKRQLCWCVAVEVLLGLCGFRVPTRLVRK
nr:MAG TPA: hypothetical protein [Bacteriophage sp.]